MLRPQRKISHVVRNSIKMMMALEVIQLGLHNENNLIFVSQSHWKKEIRGNNEKCKTGV